MSTKRNSKKAQLPGADPAATEDDAAPPKPAHAAPAMAPAVARAMEGADRMSHAEAQRLASEGKLVDRVLTEKGWYIPNADKPAE